MVGLLPQGDLEVLDRIRPAMALVLLLPAQEIIEGGLGADALGLGEFPSLPGPIILPRQERRFPQVVCA